MEKIKIYILHYGCGDGELRVTCTSKGCDLCGLKTRLYYEEKIVGKDELFELINDSSNGNYIHISTVVPDGWVSKTEYESI